MDYFYNLITIGKSEWFNPRHSGILASAYVAMEREAGRVAKYEAKKKEQNKAVSNSVHVGTVGKREVFTLTIDKVIRQESDWGITSIHLMHDASGNRVVWFATANHDDCKEGKTYEIKGTVKKHTMRDDINQTIINRCIILNQPPKFYCTACNQTVLKASGTPEQREWLTCDYCGEKEARKRNKKRGKV